MNPLKRLAGQTAVYGLSSVLGRFFNFLLVPLYTAQFLPAEYGVVTELYAYVGFANIVLTYGMETALFRFLNDKRYAESKQVYSSALISLLASSLSFCLLFLLMNQHLSSLLNYEAHPEYILWITIIIAVDALTAVPFAKLRADNQSVRFASYKLVNIGINIGLNIFFIWYCKSLLDSGSDSFFASLYDPKIGVGYIFIANLCASLVTLALLSPQLLQIRFGWSTRIWKEMIWYAFPLIGNID